MCKPCDVPDLSNSDEDNAEPNTEKPASCLGFALACLLVFFMFLPDRMVLGLAGSCAIVAVVALALHRYVLQPDDSDAWKQKSPRAARRTQKAKSVEHRPCGTRLPRAAGAARQTQTPVSSTPVSPSDDTSAPLCLTTALLPGETSEATAAQPQELKTLTLQWLSGSSTDVHVGRKTSVRELRQKVGLMYSVPARRVKFLCDFSVLQDDVQADDLASTDVVQAVLVDGWQAVSASYDHTLRVWDLLAGTCVGELSGHTNRVSCVSADFTFQRAVSASWDTTLRVWDLETMCCLGVLQGHCDSVSAVAADIAQGIAVSGSWDATIRVWDLRRLECLAALTGHLDRVVSIDVHFASGRVLSRSNDGVLKVWGLPGGCCATIDGHAGWLTVTCADLKEQRALTGAFDGLVKFWDLETGARIGDLQGHGHGVNAICADFARGQAVTGGMDGLRVWDLKLLTCIVCHASRGEVVHALTVDFEGQRAVAGSAGGTVEVWDLANHKRTGVQAGHTSLVNAVAADFARQRAVTCSTDGTLRTWDLACLGPLGDGALTGHNRAVIALCAQ